MLRRLQKIGLAMTLATTLALAYAAPAFAVNENANDIAKDKAKNKDTVAVPEISSAAASAIGLLVVGGIALMASRRRETAA